jgi:hypothetical protein
MDDLRICPLLLRQLRLESQAFMLRLRWQERDERKKDAARRTWLKLMEDEEWR